MRLGLYGGGFDPIHRGHIDPLREAVAELGLERVLYVPTAHPPHKQGEVLAPPWARYAMVELALLDEPRLAVSPHELVAGPSYTVETLEHFRRQEPAAEWVLLVGADAFAGLSTWRRWRELARLATLGVLQRPGWDGERFWSALTPELRRLAESPAVALLHNRPVALAATDLRARLAGGELPGPEELPPPVLQYIRKYALYR